MAQRRIALATFPDGGPSSAYLRLMRAALAQALRDPDVHEWIGTPDAVMLCALADVEHEAVQRALARPPEVKPAKRRRKKDCG